MFARHSFSQLCFLPLRRFSFRVTLIGRLCSLMVFNFLLLHEDITLYVFAISQSRFLLCSVVVSAVFIFISVAVDTHDKSTCSPGLLHISGDFPPSVCTLFGAGDTPPLQISAGEHGRWRSYFVCHAQLQAHVMYLCLTQSTCIMRICNLA